LMALGAVSEAAMQVDALEAPEQWLFSEGALERMRGHTHERTLQVLLSTAAESGERRQGTRESPKPLSLDESALLVQFYLQRLPELCKKCDAPSDVQWTAIVYYQRFFTARSPMEFFPQSMMFACVHLACKIEEVHEITLDMLFEHAESFGVNASLKAKVAGLELQLLHGIGYSLLVEPKPDIALPMLADELQQMPAWGGVARGSDFQSAIMGNTWQEVLSAAEQLLMHFCIRSDAILRMPASLLIAAALGTVLGRHFSLGSDGGQVLEILQSLLEASVEEPHKAAFSSMFRAALRDIERFSSLGDITEDSVKEASGIALRCHRAFERLREEATVLSEANRKERKRRWGEMKDANRRHLPTPFTQGLAELNRRIAGGSWDGVDGFVIHRPRDDIDIGHM
jgi:hypothetical protein